MHGGRIGVLVELKGGDAELATGIAMHIAAMNPPYIKAADVPADFVAKEKEIELAKMSDKDKAKPAEILEKIIGGKIAKIVNEVTLTGQPYVLDTDKTVDSRAQGRQAPKCVSFHAPRRRRRHRESGRGLRCRSGEGDAGLTANACTAPHEKPASDRGFFCSARGRREKAASNSS